MAVPVKAVPVEAVLVEAGLVRAGLGTAALGMAAGEAVDQARPVRKAPRVTPGPRSPHSTRRAEVPGAQVPATVAARPVGPGGAAG